MAVHVNVDNFVEAENARMLHDLQADAGGVNVFSHVREPSPVDHQLVVRLNRDTLYSFAVVDLALRSAGAPDQPFRLPAGVRRLQVVEDLVAEDRSVVFVMASRVGVATTWARLQRALEAAGLATAGRATAGRAPADEGGEAGAWLFEAHDAVGFLEGVIQRGPSGTRIVLVHRRHRPEAADASY